MNPAFPTLGKMIYRIQRTSVNGGIWKLLEFINNLTEYCVFVAAFKHDKNGDINTWKFQLGSTWTPMLILKEWQGKVVQRTFLSYDLWYLEEPFL
jgi:hypothetical protein